MQHSRCAADVLGVTSSLHASTLSLSGSFTFWVIFFCKLLCGIKNSFALFCEPRKHATSRSQTHCTSPQLAGVLAQ